MRAGTPLPLLLALLALGCAAGRTAAPPVHSAPIETALQAAGENRAALEQVLLHYRDGGDPLKLRAAEFLIENMAGKRHVRFGLFDSTGFEIEFDPLLFPDYDSVIAALDSIEARSGPVEFEPRERIEDLAAIGADLLIENIDLAFRAWRERPWAEHLAFEPFCDHLLPHRGSEEPLESWRPHFFERYADLADRMADPRDPVEAVRLINEDLRGWFRFDPRYYCHPTDQGLAEMLARRAGRCEDMTNLALYAMRANGIAVTADYTPYWANAGNNHAWNAVLDRDGGAVVFMGCEAHPGEYRLANAVAKVYRKGYAERRDNLAFLAGEEPIPRWLSGRSTQDVTASYVAVSDVRLPLAAPPPGGVRFAYACVFNSGEWGAVDWGRVAGPEAVFEALGRGVLYLPAFYDGERLIPAGDPFLLLADGSVRPLAAEPGNPTQLLLRSSTRRTEAGSTDAVAESFLRPGADYRLHVWRGGWEEVGRATAGEDPLRFDGVPAGSLYWLVEEGSRREERVFTYEEGRQIWW